MTKSPLAGRVVVVTGAARGIGAELARQLAGRGARPALVGLEPDELAAVAADCGPDAAWWPADVTDQAAMREVAADVVDRYGRVDAVVANAGIAVSAPLLVGDQESYDRVIEVNLLGSVRTVRAFLPELVAAKGYYLQIASAAALVPVPGMGAYCASKSGVEAFAHSVRAEVGHHGVSVGVAYPTWLNTDMVRGADAIPGVGELRAAMPKPFGNTYPLKPAVTRLVEGIERRRARVYAPGWVRTMAWARAALPSLIVAGAARESAESERIARANGIEATLPVGAGGQADRRRGGVAAG